MSTLLARFRNWGLPGFRSGTAWKQILAAIGYFVIAFWVLGAFTGRPGLAVFGLVVLATVLIVTNAWDLRSKLPLLRSPSRPTAVAGWAILGILLISTWSWSYAEGQTSAPSGSASQATANGVGGGSSSSGDTGSPAATVTATGTSTATPTPKPTPTPTPKPTPTPTATPKPTVVATQAPPPPPALTVSDSIQACVAAGNYETITVHTGAGTSIQIVVTYPSGSTDNGGTNNGTGTANASGNFTDSWRVSGNATSGVASVDISATSNGQDAAASGTFKIYHPNYGETC